eukprot:134190-Amphidinium_carterae.1
MPRGKVAWISWLFADHSHFKIVFSSVLDRAISRNAYVTLQEARGKSPHTATVTAFERGAKYDWRFFFAAWLF